MIRVFSRGVGRIPHLATFLGEGVTRGPARASELTAVAGWGLRPSAERARRYAASKTLPFLALEDAFLRSVYPGPAEAPLGIVVDDLGIYYDAGRPSRLETLIAEPLDASDAERARTLLAAWREARVSKYNHLRESTAPLPRPFVLVVDQTLGDASVRYGKADAASFQRMLQAALEENPNCTVLVKIHPEVASGRKRGYLDRASLAGLARVRLLEEDVHPVRLIEEAEAIYTVTSQVGFEGLIWNKPVRTFGMPFYAGWGPTRDELPAPERRTAASLEQIAHAALVRYPRYVDPETGRRCEVETILEHLALQRRMRERFPPRLHAAGFSPYKRALVRRFCWGSEVRFVSRRARLSENDTLLIWGSDRTRHEGPTIRLEDGFLRSVGLGADLIRPVSWVLDQRGIYYDATRPSGLEQLLETADFSPALLDRARALRERIVEANLTKYNLGGQSWRAPVLYEHGPLDAPAKRRTIVLVPGQVETDASLEFGTVDMRSNIELLRTVRRERPETYVVYKPHPDVVSGLRQPGHQEDTAYLWCDEILTDVSMSELLNEVNEVHTLTSLTGFEALLRGKRVTCYGQPFYAGWGLTSDRHANSRRTRRLTLEELIAGALILYPTYVSRMTGRFTTPERALEELLTWRERAQASLPMWRRALRVGLRLQAR